MSEGIRKLRERLDAQGGNMTKQRAAVFGYLRRMDCHPTAEEVYRGVKAELPKISLATVYKNLEALVNYGMALKVSCGDGAARYDSRTDHHYHSRCLGCGEMGDLEPDAEEAMADLIETPHGFQVIQYRVEILGYCRSCGQTRSRTIKQVALNKQEGAYE